ncbi:MAG TPA: hypothetical protein VL021_09050 [Brumimicrobium sp.]|nr:hypothetical protein [Brumimicrobium sp.]
MKNLLLLSLFALVALTSCKKCDPSNSFSGMIIEDAIIRVIGADNVGNQFITSHDQTNKKVEMSLDGGYTYELVDYAKYSIFAQSTTATCSAGYNKDISLDAKSKTVTYTIDIVECPTCKYGDITTANWVATTKIPNSYNVKFKTNFK